MPLRRPGTGWAARQGGRPRRPRLRRAPTAGSRLGPRPVSRPPPPSVKERGCFWGIGLGARGP
eukprot:4221819-Alexandrium_andersonii.AAC.1